MNIAQTRSPLLDNSWIKQLLIFVTLWLDETCHVSARPTLVIGLAGQWVSCIWSAEANLRIALILTKWIRGRFTSLAFCKCECSNSRLKILTDNFYFRKRVAASELPENVTTGSKCTKLDFHVSPQRFLLSFDTRSKPALNNYKYITFKIT